MRPPSLEDLETEPLRGCLTLLDVALIVVARAVRGAHPEVDRVARPGDAPLIYAARQIVEDADVLLHGLDRYRDHLYGRLRLRLDNDDWPF